MEHRHTPRTRLVDWNTAVMILEIIEAGLRWAGRLAVFAGLVLAAVAGAAPDIETVIDMAITAGATAAAGLIVTGLAAPLRAWIGELEDND